MTTPHPVAPMSLAEAWRMIKDPAFAEGFDKRTREAAWQMVHAARRGESVLVIRLVPGAAPLPPEDAA